jgi:hypothetical protein
MLRSAARICSATFLALATLSTQAASGQSRHGQLAERHHQHTASTEQREARGSTIVVISSGTPETEGNADNHAQEAKIQWFEGWSLSDKIALGAVLAGIGQVIALVATVLVMIDNGRKQMRAYVFIEESAILNVSPGGQPKARLKITNFGQTPAYKFYVGIENIIWVPFDRTDLLHDTKRTIPLNASQEALGPGASRFTEAVFRTDQNQPLTLTQTMFDGLVNNTHALYVYGVIFYYDAFGAKRSTQLRLYVGGPVGLGTLPGPVAHTHGNDAD